MKNSLNLFINSEDVIRSRSRIAEADQLTFNEKCPILLRNDSKFPSLVVLKCHDDVYHSGVQTTLCNLWNNYWIVWGRQKVKSILKNCCCLQHFFNRFYKEYMLALLERHALQTSTRNSNNQVKLRIVEIVIIKDDKPRLLWRKGKINRFLESRDGKVRGAELVVFQPKTKKTCMINRPIQHLVPLEVSDNFEEENDFEIKNLVGKIRWQASRKNSSTKRRLN